MKSRQKRRILYHLIERLLKERCIDAEVIAVAGPRVRPQLLVVWKTQNQSRQLLLECYQTDDLAFEPWSFQDSIGVSEYLWHNQRGKAGHWNRLQMTQPFLMSNDLRWQLSFGDPYGWVIFQVSALNNCFPVVTSYQVCFCRFRHLLLHSPSA